MTDIDFELTTEKRVIVERYIHIKDTKVKLGELYEVLGGLHGTNVMQRITIHNQEIGDLLVELDVASQNAKGSYKEGENFDEFYELIENKLLG